MTTKNILLTLAALSATSTSVAWGQNAPPPSSFRQQSAPERPFAGPSAFGNSFSGIDSAPPATPYVNSSSQETMSGPIDDASGGDSNTLPPLAPPYTARFAAPSIEPAILPPPLPARPDIPQPDGNCVLPPAGGSGIAKPSYGLHTKATQANNAIKQAPSILSARPSETSGSYSHSYLGPLEDTLLALASACSINRAVVESVDSSNGILVARKDIAGQAALRLTISARETSPSHTSVTVSGDSNALNMGQEILEKAALLMSGGSNL
jgi:hypothetical protein